MSVFAHQVGGDPLHIHELLVWVLSVWSVLVVWLIVAKQAVRDWIQSVIKKLFRSRR